MVANIVGGLHIVVGCKKTDLFELVADEGEGLEDGLGVAGHLKYQNINKIEWLSCYIIDLKLSVTVTILSGQLPSLMLIFAPLCDVDISKDNGQNQQLAEDGCF